MTIQDILPACEQYGYIAHEEGNMVCIRTKFEHWMFESNVSPKAKVKLLHRGMNAEGYHRQFHQAMSGSDLILYVHQHEVARFTKEFVNFKFTKDGVLRSSLKGSRGSKGKKNRKSKTFYA